MKMYNILIIDDEPILCHAYQMAFREISENYSDIQFNIEIRNNYFGVREEIIRREHDNNNIDLIILDVHFISKNTSSIDNGIKLGLYIRRILPSTKLFVVTPVDNNFMFYNILNKLDPMGFILKSEVDYNEFMDSVILTLQNHKVYSHSIEEFLKNEASLTLPLDEIDRNILYLLSEGFKTINLPNKILLSLSAIEKRKQKIAHTLGQDKSTTKILIESAKESRII